MDEEFKNEDTEKIDEEVSELMENYGLEQDEAEHVKEIMDEEGLDEEEAAGSKFTSPYVTPDNEPKVMVWDWFLSS